MEIKQGKKSMDIQNGFIFHGNLKGVFHVPCQLKVPLIFSSQIWDLKGVLIPLPVKVV